MGRIHRLIFLIGLCGPLGVCMPFAARGAALEGRVQDGATGLPVEGATVRLEGKIADWGGPPPTVLTGADGRFAFAGLAAVTETGFGYHVVAEKEGYFYAVTGMLQVADGETRTADLTLDRRIAVFLRVSGPDGEAVAGASAVLAIQGEPSLQSVSRTDGNGIVPMGQVRRGSGRLTAAKAGYRPLLAGVQLSGRSPAETLSVTLEPDQPATNRTLHGTVSKPGGGAASGTLLRFSCVAGTEEAWLYAVSGADGSYALETIPGACSSGFVRGPEGTPLAVQLTGSDTRFDVVDGSMPLAAGRAGGWAARRGATGKRGAVLRLPVPGGRGDTDFLGRLRVSAPPGKLPFISRPERPRP